MLLDDGSLGSSMPDVEARSGEAPSVEVASDEVDGMVPRLDRVDNNDDAGTISGASAIEPYSDTSVIDS